MLKRILVGLGSSEYTPSAVNYAVALALAHQAELTGVSILDVKALENVGPVPLGAGQFARQLAEDRVARAGEQITHSIQLFTDACEAAGVKHQVLRETAEPFALLSSKARYHDLMIFGLRSLFEFELVPDPHDALVRLVQSGVRPLLAVAAGYYPIRKVLIAYSGSMESAKTMKHFVQMRLFDNPQVRIVTFDDGGKHGPALVAEAADYCRAHGLTVETDVVAGSPQRQLLPYSEQWGADLTVIGNSAKNLLLRRVFGETALNAIRTANRPLFLAQ